MERQRLIIIQLDRECVRLSLEIFTVPANNDISHAQSLSFVSSYLSSLIISSIPDSYSSF